MFEKKFHDIILNIASGRQPIITDENYDISESVFILNMDITYDYYLDENIDLFYMKQPFDQSVEIFSNNDVFEFLDHTLIPFNRVCIYRFLEHISPNQVLYFIYQVSRVLETGGIVDVIVPNYKYLGQLLVNETLDDIKDEAKNIYLTTELLNESSDPHCSIWTEDRINYYWTLEKRFKINNINPNYIFDGRPYIRALIERI